jgi:predicted ABC-type ATPase
MKRAILKQSEGKWIIEVETTLSTGTTTQVVDTFPAKMKGYAERRVDLYNQVFDSTEKFLERLND